MYSSTRHAACLADAAEIVALEVDQHDVLGAFLRMRDQFGGLAPVLLGASPGARACRRWAASRSRGPSMRSSRSGDDERMDMPGHCTLAANGAGFARAQRVVHAAALGAIAQLRAARDATGSPGRCRPRAMCSWARAHAREEYFSGSSSSSDASRSGAAAAASGCSGRPRQSAHQSRMRGGSRVAPRPHTRVSGREVVNREGARRAARMPSRGRPRARQLQAAARSPRPSRSRGTRSSRPRTAGLRGTTAWRASRRETSASRLSRNPPGDEVTPVALESALRHRATAPRAAAQASMLKRASGPCAALSKQHRDSAQDRVAASARSAPPGTGNA